MFDYDSPAVPDTTVADVVAAIRSDGKLPSLSDEERGLRRLERELYRLECDQRREQRRVERERREQEAEALTRAVEAAEIAEANRKRRIERDAEISRQTRDREIRDLRFQAAQHRAWQNNVQTATRNAIAAHHQQALLADVERFLTPPAPAPEPEVIIEQPTEETGRLDYPKLHRWF
jgi:hypothetical protein